MARSRWWTDDDGYSSAWLDYDDTEDFGVDFTAYQSTNSETIASVEIDADGVTISNTANNGYKVSFLASAPQYPFGKAAVQITTSGSPAKTRTKTVRFYQREM